VVNLIDSIGNALMAIPQLTATLLLATKSEFGGKSLFSKREAFLSGQNAVVVQQFQCLFLPANSA